METPEYILKVNSFNEHLSGLKIENFIAYKEDYLNIPISEFKNKVQNADVMYVKSCGKWVSLALSTGQNIMIYPGVNGDILLEDEYKKDKHTNVITLVFSDGCALKSEMKLFGKYYLASEKELLKDKFSFNLGKIIPKTSLSYFFKTERKKKDNI